MTERIFIGLGSNIDAEINIPQALRLLAGQCSILALSTFYLSPAEGDPGRPPFINGAAEIATDLEPEAVKWDALRPIEEALGRVRGEDRNAPRTIDLDLLLYGDRIVHAPRLTLPDPGIARYPFVAVPLAELAPALVLPGTEMLLAQVIRSLDASGLRPLPGFTDSLKKSFAYC
jgi:2-amino-4-hydroxy-6-hydroxymethyldihydropteridine diphosphokinase